MAKRATLYRAVSFAIPFFLLIFALPVPAQVQVIPDEPEYREVTLKLGGPSCDVNQAESALLRLKGVVEVDIEIGKKKSHIVVAYDPEKVSPEVMLQAVGKKKGCAAAVAGDRRQ